MVNLKSEKSPVKLLNMKYLGFFIVFVVPLLFLFPLFLPFEFRPVLKQSFKFSFGKITLENVLTF